MQISGEANGQDISTQTLFLLGGLTVTEYPLSDQVRNFNIGSSIIWTNIFKVTGWQFDDSNQTKLPIATTQLNANQSAYTIPEPTTLGVSLRGLRASDSNGNWTELIPITEEEIINIHNSNIRSFMTTPGLPKYYRPVGNSFILYPASNVTVSAGLECSFDRGMVQIAFNATSTIPGFNAQFHEALSVFGALRFCMAYPKGLSSRIPGLQQQWNDYIGAPDKGVMGIIPGFYAKRWTDKNQGLRIKQENNK